LTAALDGSRVQEKSPGGKAISYGEARAFSRAGVRHAFAVLAARQFRGDLRLLPVARL